MELFEVMHQSARSLDFAGSQRWVREIASRDALLRSLDDLVVLREGTVQGDLAGAITL